METLERHQQAAVGPCRRFTVRVHPLPFRRRCGHGWQYCAACQASDLPEINERERHSTGDAKLRERAEIRASGRQIAVQNLSATNNVGRPRKVAVESHLTDNFAYLTQRELRRGRRIESALVADFCRLLKAEQRRHSALEAETDDGLLRCDLVDETQRIRFEAKATTHRMQIRLAVGQLLDYSYFLLGPRRRFGLAILVPERPPEQVVAWLRTIGVGVAYRNKETFRAEHP